MDKPDYEKYPSADVMGMLAEAALRQVFESVAMQLREFADSPAVEGISGRAALIAASEASLNANDSVFGVMQ